MQDFADIIVVLLIFLWLAWIIVKVRRSNSLQVRQAEELEAQRQARLAQEQQPDE